MGPAPICVVARAFPARWRAHARRPRPAHPALDLVVRRRAPRRRRAIAALVLQHRRAGLEPAQDGRFPAVYSKCRSSARARQRPRGLFLSTFPPTPSPAGLSVTSRTVGLSSPNQAAPSAQGSPGDEPFLVSVSYA